MIEKLNPITYNAIAFIFMLLLIYVYCCLDTAQWVQVDLGVIQSIKRIITQGENGAEFWTKTYKVKHGLSAHDLRFIQNNDMDQVSYIFCVCFMS